MTLVTGRPANDDMVRGYLEGRDIDSPEPNENRSASYRHGFAVGRSEKKGQSLGSYYEVSAAADRAMAEDDERSV